MKMQYRKRLVQSQMAYNNWLGCTIIGGPPAASCSLGDLLLQKIQEAEAAKVEFVCERVKDGIVVDTFDTLEDAFALVQKHIKGRKAKLQVRNSGTGELEAMFEESAV